MNYRTDLSTYSTLPNFYGLLIYAEDRDGYDLGTMNDCTYEKVGSGCWMVYSTNTNFETARAKVFMSVFYGTNGNNPLYGVFTGVYKICTWDSGDVGMRLKFVVFNAYANKATGYRYNDDVVEKRITFSAGSGNRVSTWTSVASTYLGDGYPHVNVQCPSGTTLAGSADGSGAANHFGQDRSTWEKNNPSSWSSVIGGVSDWGTSDLRSTSLIGWTKGDATINTNILDSGKYTADFSLYTDSVINYDIPFEMVSYTDTPVTLTFKHELSETVTDIIPTWNAQIDSLNVLTVRASSDGVNWEKVDECKMHRLFSPSNKVYLKFEIKRNNTAVADKISEYAIWYNCGGA